MERYARSFRMIQVALVLVLATGMLSTTGCSWFRHNKADQAKTTEMTPSTNPNPQSVEPSGHRPGDLADLPQMKTIYFAYDKSNIRADQVGAMEDNLKFLQANPNIKVYITGHCDERGSVEYNFNLGMRRATAVKDYFVKKGIPTSQLEPASKGKEQPAVAGKGEAVYSKNRRAQFQQMF